MERLSQFQSAIDQIAEEKGIDKKIILETIELALAAAYRKDYGTPDQNIVVKFDAETGDIKVYDQKTVVEALDEEMEKKAREYVLLADAQKENPDAKVGDVVKKEITPAGDYGRIAAQTAKQVIIQRIREAEREAVTSEFSKREGEILNGSVQRVEDRAVFVDLGHTTGIMPIHEQSKGETYRIGQRLKVLVVEVRQGRRGPEVIVSRSHPKLIQKLFELEVPEIFAGTVVIDAIAREAGSRTKMAVHATQEGIDPVGSCVGQRGTRVQTVLSELGAEKIDIIEFATEQPQFIAQAMSPAKVMRVDILNEETREARVVVDDDQLSLAIGKGGQNVRLAVKLTGWKIDVAGLSEMSGGGEKKEGAVDEAKAEKTEKKEDKKEVAEVKPETEEPKAKE